MITSISVEGFKSINSQTLSLGKTNVIIGANGVGKSNFISIFALTKNLLAENLQRYVLKKGGADALLHFGSKTTTHIKVAFEFDGKNQFYYDLEVGQDTLFIRELGTKFFNNIWHPKIYSKDVLESDFSKVYYSQAFFVNPKLNNVQVYHFHDTSDDSPIKKPSDINDNQFLKPNGSNIAAFLYYLSQKHPQKFRLIEGTVRSIAPFFDCFALNPSNLNSDLVHLEWRAKGSENAYFNAYHLSDGTLRFICLATLLLQPSPPKTIIIDEPELGLHPVAINVLASIISSMPEEFQIIVSTQSVGFIDNFTADDVIVANSVNFNTQFTRLSSEKLKDWLSDFSVGELWEKNLFGGQPINDIR
jgi:predicted ATPase